MDTLFELPEKQAQKPKEPTRPENARVVSPVRNQVELLPRDLDSALPEDHVARAIWGFLKRLDLSAFYAEIKAVLSVPGRPATDPEVLLALWLCKRRLSSRPPSGIKVGQVTPMPPAPIRCSPQECVL